MKVKQMSHFIKNGSLIQVADTSDLTVFSRLPAATYVVNFNTEKGFFLKEMEPVRISGKVYGGPVENCERYFKAFEHESGNMGILLVGEKGSGKTLQAKMVSLKGYELGFPTLVINEPHCGDGFNKFMQAINQPIIVLFDEFEKVYDEEDQEEILTLLDGTFDSHKMFILTANKYSRLDRNLHNRPGRIRYSTIFKGISEDMISEYVIDQGWDKATLDQVLRISRVFSRFNFDMLASLLKECKTFDETPIQAVKKLGYKPETMDAYNNCYDIFVVHKGITLSRENQVPTDASHPLSFDKIYVYFDESNLDISSEKSFKSVSLEDRSYNPSWSGATENRKSVTLDMASKDMSYSKRGIEYKVDEDTTVLFVKQSGVDFDWENFE